MFFYKHHFVLLFYADKIDWDKSLCSRDLVRRGGTLLCTLQQNPAPHFYPLNYTAFLSQAVHLTTKIREKYIASMHMPGHNCFKAFFLITDNATYRLNQARGLIL